MELPVYLYRELSHDSVLSKQLLKSLSAHFAAFHVSVIEKQASP